MKLHKIAFILLVIGGLNWLLEGIFGWEIGRFLGGDAGMGGIIPKIIYVLVGLSALYEIFTHKDNCKNCSVSAPSSTGTPGQM